MSRLLVVLPLLLTLLAASDARAAAPQCGAALTVVRAGVTRPVALNCVSSDARTYTVETAPVRGTLGGYGRNDFNEDTVAYTAPIDAAAGETDTFTMRATGPTGESDITKITVTFQSKDGNEPPTCTATGYVADTDVRGRVPCNDPDRDDLTYELLEAPAHGKLVLEPGGWFTFSTRVPDRTTAVVRVTDSQGASARATMTLNAYPHPFGNAFPHGNSCFGLGPISAVPGGEAGSAGTSARCSRRSSSR